MPAPESENTGLTPIQERAVLALLVQPSINKAAESVGVDERTVRRWLKEPAFKAAFDEAQRETFGQGMALLLRYIALAVNTLAKTMSDPGAPHSAKVSAAGIVLKQGRESIELSQALLRIEALERDARERENKQ